MSVLLRIAAVTVTLLYPFAVYFGLLYFDPRMLVLLILAIAGVRLLTLQQTPINHWLWIPLLGVLAAWTWLANTDLGLKLYPVLVNLSLLLMFGWTLKYPPSMIQRLARFTALQETPEAIAYTRKVTVVWCVFFFCNAGAALSTGLWASDAVWALYNGFIAYVLMALVFAVEWLVRLKVRKQIDG